MGTRSSKEAEQTLPPGASNPIIGYRKSVYGWGKLSHPVRKYKVLNTKKKGKASKTRIAESNTEPLGLVVQQTRLVTITPPKEIGNKQRDSTQNNCSNSNSDSVINTGNGNRHLKLPMTSSSKSDLKLNSKKVKSQIPDFPSNSTDTGLNTKSSQKLDSKTPVPVHVHSKPTFYGKYRCAKCGKYWVSGLAKAGVPQQCRGCRTPTFPML